MYWWVGGWVGDADGVWVAWLRTPCLNEQVSMYWWVGGWVIGVSSFFFTCRFNRGTTPCKGL